METPSPKSFLEYLLSIIIEDETSFSVTETQDELGTLFTIEVSEEKMGKLIGKNGQTIQSLRTLIRVLGSQRRERINLKVLEPGA